MNKNIIILVILIVLVVLLIITYKKKTNKIQQINQVNSSNYNYFWVYWDDLNGRDNRPAYIDLCLQTIKKHTTKDFNLVMLSKENIDNYLPELVELRKQVDLDKLVLAQKVDLYRIMLL